MNLETHTSPTNFIHRCSLLSAHTFFHTWKEILITDPSGQICGLDRAKWKVVLVVVFRIETHPYTVSFPGSLVFINQGSFVYKQEKIIQTNLSKIGEFICLFYALFFDNLFI